MRFRLGQLISKSSILCRLQKHGDSSFQVQNSTIGLYHRASLIQFTHTYTPSVPRYLISLFYTGFLATIFSILNFPMHDTIRANLALLY
jgi:hypothetical protein